MCLIIFTDQKQTGGIPVDAVHNARTQHAVDTRKTGSRMEHDGINQSSRFMTRCRVDNHTFRFIDNHEPVILVYNIQRNILRFDL